MNPHFGLNKKTNLTFTGIPSKIIREKQPHASLRCTDAARSDAGARHHLHLAPICAAARAPVAASGRAPSAGEATGMPWHLWSDKDLVCSMELETDVDGCVCYHHFTCFLGPLTKPVNPSFPCSRSPTTVLSFIFKARNPAKGDKPSPPSRPPPPRWQSLAAHSLGQRAVILGLLHLKGPPHWLSVRRCEGLKLATLKETKGKPPTYGFPHSYTNPDDVNKYIYIYTFIHKPGRFQYICKYIYIIYICNCLAT